MLGLSFTKLPRNRRFKYRSVYYDKNKEDLHKRVDQAKAKYHGESNPELAKERIKDIFDRRYRKEYHVFNDNSLYKLRVVAIVLVLSLIAYVAWESDLLDSFIGFFLNG